MSGAGVVLVLAMLFLGYEAIQLLRPGAPKAVAAATPPSTGVLPGASGVVPGGPVNAPQGVMSSLMAAISLTGVPASWLQPLLYIQQHENAAGDPSIQNPAAVNGEHATGLMQLLPSTFAANKLPGLDDITSPLDNAVAAIRYIQARYGDPWHTPWLNGTPNPQGY